MAQGDAGRAMAALLLVLALPLGAPAAAGQSGPGAGDPGEAAPELRPIEVALEALPVALRSAIAEAEDHLLADRAQRQLDETHAYVQGFTALPAGDGALQGTALRQAYAWTEDVVVTFLALPATASGIEAAGATCRSEFETVRFEEGKAAVERGLASARRLDAIDRQVASLLARAPSLVDLAPVEEAAALLRGWRSTEVVDVESCLTRLAERLGLGEVTFLDVQVVPDRIHPTGRIQVFGSVAGAAAVRVEAPGIGWVATLAATNGTFHADRTVPRTAALATHALTFSAADRTAVATLAVAKAAVDLDAEAPRRVDANGTFLLRATVGSVAGPAEVDRADLEVRWRGVPSVHGLAEGGAAVALAAASPGRHALEVRYPGTDILEAAAVEIEVVVVDPAIQAVEAPRGDRIEEALAAAYPWWLVAAATLLLAVALAWAVGRLRSRGAGEAVAAPARANPFPGADTFAAAVAVLFASLRRLGLVPPGRTVREWLRATDGPSVVADRFEAVRYGPFRETPTLAEKGRAWVQRAWRRWLP